MRVIVQTKAAETAAAVEALKKKGFVQDEQWGVKDDPTAKLHQRFVGEWPDTLTKLRTEFLVAYAWEDIQAQPFKPSE